MDNSITNNFPRTSRALADRAGKASDRVQSMGQQGVDAMTDMAGQVRDATSNVAESIVSYTKKNPVQALAIAAGVGALLYWAIKAVTPSRD
jgi:ElaB/YqjD/DUF883 family membrane-anchored ribosome-binding protein